MCKKCVSVSLESLSLEGKTPAINIMEKIKDSFRHVSDRINSLGDYDKKLNVIESVNHFYNQKKDLINFLGNNLKVELPIESNTQKYCDNIEFYPKLQKILDRLVNEKNLRNMEKMRKLHSELRDCQDDIHAEIEIMQKINKIVHIECYNINRLVNLHTAITDGGLYTIHDVVDQTFPIYSNGDTTYSDRKTFKKGIKFTRIVNDIFGIEYADLFAMGLQEAMGTVKENYTLFLSVDPLDFLLMSDKENNAGGWSSCHNYVKPDNGNACYRQGTVSHMFDNVSMVAYLLNSDNKKVFRQLYFLDLKHTTIVSGKHYPKTMESIEENIINFFAHKLEVKKVDVSNKDCMLSNKGEGYKDSPTNVYSKNENGNDIERIIFGSKYCVACNMLNNEMTDCELLCNECYEDVERVTCYRCDYRIDVEDSIYSDITCESYCSECFHEEFTSCECCGEYYIKEDLKAVKKYSHYQKHYIIDQYFCEYCLDNGKTRQSYCKCGECGYYYSIDDTYYFEDDAICHDCGDPDEIYLCDTDGFYKYKKDDEFLECDCDACNELKPEEEEVEEGSEEE